MIGSFGGLQFGNDGYISSNRVGKNIALLGDGSSHGGSIVSTGGNSTFDVAGTPVALNGAMHSCPIPYHGTTTITAVTIKSYGPGGQLILTQGAVAGCGAVITPSDRGVYVE